MNRGDRREPIFHDDADRHLFLKTLGETCAKTDWQVHAFCLMSNHFHLVVETPEANLVAGMKWFLGTYTARFNRRHQWFGHLFSGRYKSLVVGGEGGYLRTVCEYVHLNPARAKLLKPEQVLRDYPWSSCCEYLKAPSQRPAWLRVDRVFGEMGIPRDSAAGRRQFESRMEERRQAEAGPEWKVIRRGWCFGGAAFRKELLAQMSERMGEHHGGREKKETAVEKAERIAVEELKRRRWHEAELQARRKGDAQKVQIARRLRTETTVTLKWIGKRLVMGAPTNVANLLRKGRREG